MTFKEFSKWCNERACDGCWGMYTAMVCINACSEVLTLPFWKREKAWQKINAESEIVELFVKPTNAKIEEVLGKRESNGNKR